VARIRERTQIGDAAEDVGILDDHARRVVVDLRDQPVEARPVVRTLADRGILAGVSLGRLYPGKDELANGLVVAVTETTTAEDVETLASALSTVLGEILA